MKFVGLTLFNGGTITINADHIVTLRPKENGNKETTIVTDVNGDGHQVTETLQEILAKI